MSFTFHIAHFGELAAADVGPLSSIAAVCPQRVVAFGGNQILAHGDTPEGIALTVTAKAKGTGTDGIMYAEDEWMRNPTAAKGMNWSAIKRASVIGAMRAARLGKRCGLYHLPIVNIDQRHAAETRATNDSLRDLIACCEVALTDIYMPEWNVADLPGGANFYAENVPGALAEACRVPRELGIPVFPFIQFTTTNGGRDLTDDELRAISPAKLAAVGCAGAVTWAWAPVGTPGVLDRLNANIRRYAKVATE